MGNNKIYGNITGNTLSMLFKIMGIFLFVLGLIIAYGGGNVDERDGFLEGLVLGHGNGANYAFVVWAGVISLIVAGVTSVSLRGMSLEVSDTYVTGTVAYSRSVNLPINQISAIAQGAFGKLFVATSSGRVCFWFVENRDEICAFLAERIGRTNAYAVPQNPVMPVSGADELKKYKALLDEGIITQEEFNEKKKKLMDL